MIYYADEIILCNTLINYLLLLVCCYLARCETSRLRLLLSSLLSAVYSFCTLFPSLSLLYILPFRLLFGFVASFAALVRKDRRRIIRFYIIYFAVSLLFGGLIYSLSLFFSDFKGKSGLFVPASLKTAAVAAALLCFLISSLFRHIIPARGIEIRTAKLFLCGRDITLRTLTDSGSSLRDPLRNTPILVINRKLAAPLLPPALYNGIEASRDAVEALSITGKSELRSRFGILPCRTASGNALLLTLRCDKLLIENESLSPLVALSDAGFDAAESYDAVIGIK